MHFLGQAASKLPELILFAPAAGTRRSVPFEEGDWVGGVLSFRETDEAAAIGLG